MVSGIEKEDLTLLQEFLRDKSIKISETDIKNQLGRIVASQEIFPLNQQRAMLLQLLVSYDRSRQQEMIILEVDNDPTLPVIVKLGILAEDWPGMSNSILGIIHHKERNVLFVKGFTVECQRKDIGIVILAFKLKTEEEYKQFFLEKIDLLAKIKEASIGTRSKYVLLEDETVKFEIYNDIIKRIKQVHRGSDIVKLTGESGEAIKFVSSRSREYLEERMVEDLASLIIDNFMFQEKIRSGACDELIKIKNFETKYEKLTGLTFVCREELISIEDFLKTLNFIVPAYIIKHHKSFVAADGILVYRIEIVDRYGKPLNKDMIKSIEKSLDKVIVTSFQKNFSQIKSIGGYEHYARATIPFLMMELKKTGMSQVFIKVDDKTDFSIDIKLIVVTHGGKSQRMYHLIPHLEKIPGIHINSAIPPKHYHDNVEIDVLKLTVELAEFSSIKEIFSSLKDSLKKVYGDIRDFDQGFREIDMRVLNDLVENLSSINASLIRDIFFNFDELFRIEIPRDVLYEVIRLCSEAIEACAREPGKKVVIQNKNLPRLNRTVFIVSYRKRRNLLGRILKKYKGYGIYFTKIEWDQRTYSILIIHKNNQALNRNENNEMKGYILGLLK